MIKLKGRQEGKEDENGGYVPNKNSKGCLAGVSIEMRPTIDMSYDKILRVVPQIDQDKWRYTRLFDSQTYGETK